MKRFAKVFLLVLMLMFSGLTVFVGCGTLASKVTGVISEEEITVYFDELDGDISKTFTVELDGLTEEMSRDVEFNFENKNVANINFVNLEENVATYKVTANLGGSSEVFVIHKDTNKIIGSLRVNAVRKLRTISLNPNKNPFIIVNEAVKLNASELLVLSPSNTTQSNISFKLKSSINGVSLSENGTLNVTQMPAGGKVTVTAYSLDNSEVADFDFDITVVERPNIDSVVVYNAENAGEVFYKDAQASTISLISNMSSRSDVIIRTSILGNTNVTISYESANEQIIEIYSLNKDEIRVLSGTAGSTYLTVKIAVNGFEDVYSLINIPVTVVELPTKVLVNNDATDKALDIYTYYANGLGAALKLEVDIYDASTNGNQEIRLGLDKTYRDLFKFYYEDGVTPVDIDNDVIPNGTTIYVMANSDAVLNHEELSTVLYVESARAINVGANIRTNITLNARVGATQIGIKYVNDSSREAEDKTVYIAQGQTVTMACDVNQGAYLADLKFDNSNAASAEFSYNYLTGQIEIKGLKEGKGYFQIITENGIESEQIPFVVFTEMTYWQIKTDNATENEYIAQAIYDNSSLEFLAMVAKHGVSTYIETDGTIISQEFTSNNEYIIVNRNGYVYSASPAKAQINVNVASLRYIANNGNAQKVNQEAKVFAVESFVSINKVYLTTEKLGSNKPCTALSLYSLDKFLDEDFFYLGNYQEILEVKVNPASTVYENLIWNITNNDYISLEDVFVENANGEYGLDVVTGKYEKYDKYDGVLEGRYSIVENKKKVIVKDYNNYEKNTSATVYVSIVQYGKTYTTSCKVFGRSEIPTQGISVNTNSVYFEKDQTGIYPTEYQLQAKVINDNAENKAIKFSVADPSIISVSANGLIVPLKAGATQISISFNNNRKYDGTIGGYTDVIVKVVVADGLTLETAYHINSQEKLVKALERQSLDTADYRYYVVTRDLDLTTSLSSYNTFKGYLGSYEGKRFAISNINVIDNDANNSLFKTVASASEFENLTFNFVDSKYKASKLATIAPFIGSAENGTSLKNIKVVMNNLIANVDSVTNACVGGIIGSINASRLTNVQFIGNITVNVLANVNSLYVGAIAGYSNNSTIENKNINFNNNSISTEIKATINVEVDEIITTPITNSAVGGLVGRAISTTLNNANVEVDIYANILNNVGGAVGYAENSSLNHILVSGIVKGYDNVGGAVGYGISTNINKTIVEIYSRLNMQLNDNGEFEYIVGNQNVGGFIGLAEATTDNNARISESYIRAYSNYLVIIGNKNVGGFIGNGSYYNLSKAYAYCYVSSLSETVENVAALVGIANTIKVETAFFKGKTPKNVLINGTNSTISEFYAIVNETCYHLFDVNGNNVDLSGISDVDLPTEFKTQTFFSDYAKFKFATETDLSNTWNIGEEYNDGNPIFRVEGVIAEKNISEEAFNNALSGLDSINASTVAGFLMSGRLSTGEKYFIFETGKTYDLSSIFKFGSFDLVFATVNNDIVTELDNPVISLNKEQVINLRIYAKLNPNLYVDVIIVGLNKITSYKLSESIENLNNTTIYGTTFDLTMNVNISKNVYINTNVNSDFVKFAYTLANNDCFSITGLTTISINGVSYYVTNSLTSVISAKDQTGLIQFNGYFVVEINGECILLDYPMNGNNNISTGVAISVNVQDKSTNFSLSASEITMSLTDEFNINMVIENQQAGETICYEMVEEFDNTLKLHDEDLSVNAIGTNITDRYFSNVENYGYTEDIKDSTSLVLLTQQDSATSYNLNLIANSIYLDSNNIIDYDNFTFKLRIWPSTNKALAQILTVNVVRQDILKTTLEYYAYGQTSMDNNNAIYEPNEMSGNSIIPGQTGLLTVSMYPDYASYDVAYITAIAENGETVYLTQKALISINDGEGISDKQFVSIMPSPNYMENGIYVRKISTANVTSGADYVYEEDLSYNGTLYITVFIPKTVSPNVKFTFTVTTFRTDNSGNIIENSKRESRPFYLYSAEIPSVEINVGESENNRVVIKDGSNFSDKYISIVRGTTELFSYTTTNFNGIASVKYSAEYPNGKTTLDTYYQSVDGGIFETLYNANKNIAISASIDNNIINLSVPLIIPAGTKIVLRVEISQYVDGILIQDYYDVKFVVVDYRLNDIYISENENATYSEQLRLIHTISNTLYVNFDYDLPQTNFDDVNSYAFNQIEGISLEDTQKNEIINYFENKVNADIQEFCEVNQEYSLGKFINVDNKTLLTINKGLPYNDGSGEYVFSPSFVVEPEELGFLVNILKLRAYYYYDITNASEIMFETINENKLIEINHEFDINSVDGSSLEQAIPIYTVQEFLGMSSGSHYILMNDLDFVNDYLGENTWHSSLNFDFASLNGNGKTIRTNMLTKTVENGSENIGFFGEIKTGCIIKNLSIKYVSTDNHDFNIDTLSSANIGLFAGQNNGILFNCHVGFESSSSKVINFVNHTENSTIKFGGFVGVNSSTGYITNCDVKVTSQTINEETKQVEEVHTLKVVATGMFEMAGFVSENNGNMSKCYAYNILLENSYDDALVAGFVVNNSSSAKISEAFAESNAVATTGNLLSAGNIGGFVYSNIGEIVNAYANLTMQTPSRSAGFVFENGGTITASHTLCKAILTDAEQADEQESRAHTPFTGTSELNEVLNDGKIKNSYYKVEEQDLETYGDLMFDEPAIYVAKSAYIEENLYGLDFQGDANFATWIFENGYPQLTFSQNPISLKAGENTSIDDDEDLVLDPNDKIGTTQNNPYPVNSADTLLRLLVDDDFKVTTTAEDEIGNVIKQEVVKLHIQLMCDINMDEVANDNRLKLIQQKIFIGSIDGNGYEIHNLSVLLGTAEIGNRDSFGFFNQIGATSEQLFKDNQEVAVTSIKNLKINIKQMDSSTAVSAGILSGKMYNAQIVNVHLNGEGVIVSGANRVGALTGYAENTYLANISSNLSVTAGYDSLIEGGANKFVLPTEENKKPLNNTISYAGGIVGVFNSLEKVQVNTILGALEEADEKKYEIVIKAVQLLTYGEVQISGDHAGGVFGYHNSRSFDLKFEMMETKNAQRISGAYALGGLVAQNTVESIIEFSRVEVEDSLIQKYDDTLENKKVDTLFVDEYQTFNTYYVGGLVGYDEGGQILYSYNKANVIHYNASYLGGIAGKITLDTIINEVYVTGNVYAGNNYVLPNLDENGNEVAYNLQTWKDTTEEVTLIAKNIAGGAIGLVDTGSVTTTTLPNLTNIVTINNIMQPSNITFNSQIGLTHLANLKSAKVKDIITVPANIYGFIGKLLTNSNNEITSVTLENAGTNLSNYSYIKDGMSYSSATITGITKISNDRIIFKNSYGTSFANYNEEKWNEIDLNKSYYPTLAFSIPTNIRDIYTAKDLEKYLNSSTYGKTYILRNDIYLEKTWVAPSTFQGTLTSAIKAEDASGKTYFYTIYNINLQGDAKEKDFGFFGLLDGGAIRNVNFVYGTNICYDNNSINGTNVELIDGDYFIPVELIKDNNNVYEKGVYYYKDVNGLKEINFGKEDSIKQYNEIIANNADTVFYTKCIGSYEGELGVTFENKQVMYAGLLAGRIQNSRIQNCNIKINKDISFNINSQIEIATLSEGDESINETNAVGLLIGKSTGSQISGINLSIDNQVEEEMLNVRININNDKNSQIGGLIGLSNDSIVKNISLFENNNVKVEIESYKVNEIGGVFGSASSSNVTDINCNLDMVINLEATLNNHLIGGFAGKFNTANASQVNITTNIEIMALGNDNSTINFGGFAGDVSSCEEINNAFVNMEATTAEKIIVNNFGGFVALLDNANIKNSSANISANLYNAKLVGGFIANATNSMGECYITNCGVNGSLEISKSDSQANIGGFVGQINIATINRCFTLLSIQSNAANIVGGFAQKATKSVITNSYTASKLDVDNVNSVSGFVANSDDASTYEKCFSVSTILTNSYENAYGFANSANCTNCYYVYNLAGVEHNGIAIATSRDGLISAFNSGEFFATNISEYPMLKKSEEISATGGTLEIQLFSASVHTDGLVLDPIDMSLADCKTDENDNKYYELEENKYYLISSNFNRNLLNATIPVTIKMANNSVLVGYNALLNVTTIDSNSAENYYIAGITINNENSKIGFINENKGKIFNCYAKGVLSSVEDSQNLYGFTYVNYGQIVHSGTTLQYDVNKLTADVSGFLSINNGLIENCYVIGTVKDYLMTDNSTDRNDSGLHTGFVDANYTTGTIRNCYTAFADLGKGRFYQLFQTNAGVVENCLYDYNANSMIITGDDDKKSDFLGIRNKFVGTSADNYIWLYNDAYNFGYPTLKDYGYESLKQNTSTYLDNYYLVNSYSTLDYYMTATSTTNGSAVDKYFNIKLFDNIDMSKAKVTNSAYYYKDYLDFDGGNYIIYNTEASLFSLGSTSNSSKIKNLGVVGNITLNGDNAYAGGIVSSTNGIIEFNKCFTKIDIYTNYTPNNAPTAVYMGGLIGKTEGNAIFTNCQTIGDINISQTLTHENSSGDFIASTIYAGGFIGKCGGSITMQNNFTIATIDTKENAIINSGAFVGYVTSYSTNNLRNYYNPNLTLVSPETTGYLMLYLTVSNDAIVLSTNISGFKNSTNRTYAQAYPILTTFETNTHINTLLKLSVNGTKMNPYVLDSSNYETYFEDENFKYGTIVNPLEISSIVDVENKFLYHSGVTYNNGIKINSVMSYLSEDNRCYQIGEDYSKQINIGSMPSGIRYNKVTTTKEESKQSVDSITELKIGINYYIFIKSLTYEKISDKGITDADGSIYYPVVPKTVTNIWYNIGKFKSLDALKTAANNYDILNYDGYSVTSCDFGDTRYIAYDEYYVESASGTYVYNSSNNSYQTVVKEDNIFGSVSNSIISGLSFSGQRLTNSASDLSIYNTYYTTEIDMNKDVNSLFVDEITAGTIKFINCDINYTNTKNKALTGTNVGGIVSKITTEENVYFIDCYANGLKLRGNNESSNYLGGLVGIIYNANDIIVTNCTVANATLENESNSGYVGGLIGQILKSNNINFENNNISTIDLKATNTLAYAYNYSGGIVGMIIAGNGVNAKNNKVDGAIETSVGGQFVGGYFGSIRAKYTKIELNTTETEIKVTNATSAYVGTIIGMSYGTVSIEGSSKHLSNKITVQNSTGATIGGLVGAAVLTSNGDSITIGQIVGILSSSIEITSTNNTTATVGGIIGAVAGYTYKENDKYLLTKATIRNVIEKGKITITGSREAYAGGLIGSATTTSLEIVGRSNIDDLSVFKNGDTFSTIAVTASSKVYMGGYVAYYSNIFKENKEDTELPVNVTITNPLYFGSIKGGTTSEDGIVYAGGLFGLVNMSNEFSTFNITAGYDGTIGHYNNTISARIVIGDCEQNGAFVVPTTTTYNYKEAYVGGIVGKFYASKSGNYINNTLIKNMKFRPAVENNYDIPATLADAYIMYYDKDSSAHVGGIVGNATNLRIIKCKNESKILTERDGNSKLNPGTHGVAAGIIAVGENILLVNCENTTKSTYEQRDIVGHTIAGVAAILDGYCEIRYDKAYELADVVANTTGLIVQSYDHYLNIVHTINKESNYGSKIYYSGIDTEADGIIDKKLDGMYTFDYVELNDFWTSNNGNIEILNLQK